MTKRRKPKIITPEAARKRGLARYFTGKPCERGHLCERLVSNNNCLDCQRINHKRHRQTSKWLENRRRYYHSPKGRQRRQSPKYLENRRRLRQTPIGREAAMRRRQHPRYIDSQWRYRQTPKGRETERRRQHKKPYRDAANKRRRAHRLERFEAAYNANPTQANYIRLMALIARRRRDGR